MRCQERSGFLTRHQCENPATRKCHYCKKPICDQHARPVEEPGPAGQEAQAGAAPVPAGMGHIPGLGSELEGYEGEVACIDCMKKRFAEPDVQGVESRQTRWFRRRYYYDPYFYGHYHHYHPYGIRSEYDREDYQAFDKGESAADDLDNS